MKGSSYDNLVLQRYLTVYDTRSTAEQKVQEYLTFFASLGGKEMRPAVSYWMNKRKRSCMIRSCTFHI